ncbi:MAG: TIGR04282 family arsenosugar biosynthesis glycosyltransferase [Candidatus Eiseniibacteriota bacterium]|jgi:rSAM/selenodomain-associated transferase 1
MTVRRCLGVLAKWPLVGQVKTRLTPPLDPAAAARLYTAGVADLLERLSAVRAEHALLLDRAVASPATLGWPPWAVVPQVEGDLGARLAAARETLAGAGPGDRRGGEAPSAAHVVLVGADHFTLPARHLERAFSLLEGADVVLGPTFDGGYYAIGLAAAQPALFTSMPWSHPELLARTLDRATALGLRVAALPPWYDVDDGGDLDFLRQHLRLEQLAGGTGSPRTHRVLVELGGPEAP